MNQYLQPSTLFAGKFDQYLNQRNRTINTKSVSAEEERILELSRQRMDAMEMITDDSEFF